MLIDQYGNTASVTGKKVIFYGASTRNKRAIDELHIHENVLFFIDNNKSKHGTKMDGYEVHDTNELQKYINSEIRVSAIGHAQRGGSPCPYDRMMATRFGIEGAKLVLENNFGRLVVLKGQEVTSIPLIESAGKLKYVDPSGELVQAARFMGISFGD